jgi:O-antigen ligase/tetratricopeptide (TPR) repeat protein
VLLFALLLAVPLVFCTFTVSTFEANKIAVLFTVAIVAGAAALWHGASWLRSSRHDRLMVGLLLVTLSAAISTVFSVSPLISWRGDTYNWFGLRTSLALLVVYVVARHACRTWDIGRNLLAASLMAAGVASAYALVQWTGHDPLKWQALTTYSGRVRPIGTLGHPTHLGAYLAMVLPVAAELARRAVMSRRWAVASLLGLLIVAAGLVLVLTYSRAAWLATTAAFLLLFVAWWHAGHRRLVGIIGGAILLSGAMGLSLLAQERMRHLLDGSGRYQIWTAAWHIFQDRPIQGCGTDAFRLSFGSHRPLDYWDEEGHATPSRAHNEVLHVLATQGTIGGVALLVVVVGVIGAGVRAWRRAGPADRPFVAAVAAGVVAFLVSGLFGFTVAATGTLFVVFAAMLSRGAAASPGPDELVRSATWSLITLRIGLGVGCGALLWLTVVQPFRASMACVEGDRLLRFDLPAARAAYDRAVALDPDNESYWTSLAGAAQLESRRAGTPEEWAVLDAEAIRALDQAAALVPADPYLRTNRARWLGERAFLGRGDAAAALSAWDTALERDPDNAELLAEAGRTALALGAREIGVGRLKHGLEHYPQFAPFQAQLGTLALAEGRLDEARQRLEAAVRLDWKNDLEDRARARGALAAVYLQAGCPELALDSAAAAVADLPDWPRGSMLLGQALEALGRYEEAGDAYHNVLQLDPSNTEARTALLRLEPPR